MALQAVGERVVIRQKSAEQVTASGLVIPDSVQEKPQEGVVISVGDVKDVKVGYTVIFSKYGATTISNEGEEFVICEARDILAVIY